MDNKEEILNMKKQSLAVATAALLILASCQPATNSPSNSVPSTASKVATVTPLTPSNVIDSGATAAPTTIADIKTLVVTALSTDSTGSSPSLQFQTIFADLQNVSGDAQAKVINDALANFNTQLNNFSTAKSASFSADLSGQDLGQYFTIATGTATANLTATTHDGLAISTTSSNIKSLSGSALASVVLNLRTDKLVKDASGAIKDLKVRANFGADASMTTDSAPSTWTNTTIGKINMAVNYKASASVAISVNTGTLGGKVIVSANSAYDHSKTYLSTDTLSPDNLAAEFVPSGATFTLDVYDDAGDVKFTKTYDSVAKILEDFNKAPNN